MGPSNSRVGYSSSSHALVGLSGSTAIPRKPKRKTKLAFAVGKHD